MPKYSYGQQVHVHMDFTGHIGGKRCDGKEVQVRKPDGSAIWIDAEHVEPIFGAEVIPLVIRPLTGKRQDDRYAHLPSDVEPGGDAA